MSYINSFKNNYQIFFFLLLNFSNIYDNFIHKVVILEKTKTSWLTEILRR